MAANRPRGVQHSMNILAFDTCLDAVSVALGWTGADGSPRRTHRWEERSTGHAERLFPMIADVLAEAALPFSAIHRIAVTVGPGTFTGVRIGIAAARGFKLTSSCPVVGMTSLAVMALTADRRLGAARAGRHLLVTVDARRGQVYALHTGSRLHDPLFAPVLLSIDAVVAASPSAPLVVVGSGAPLVVDGLRARGIEAQTLLDDLEPDACDLLGVAETLTPLDAVHPLYIRAPDAKPPAPRASLRA